MKKLNWLLLASIVLCTTFAAFAESKSKEELARQVISNNEIEAVTAIKSLREMGKDGLDVLFQTYSAEIVQFSKNGEANGNWRQIAFALDSVAMQKDAYASHLFWFTDLAEAQKQADKSNKPILSLRLLGNLNEEFSCANSRFFRALLYSNSEISKYLRENYVLHWKSVRPAPKVTIDFGDGRRIERTLTGNSIHYILDEDGEVIDAIPGLYSPSGFLKYITQAREFTKKADGLPQNQKEIAVLRYRRVFFDDIKTKREKILAASNVKFVEPTGTSALEVAPIATAKMVTEVTILRGIYDNFQRYEPQIISEDWKKLAERYAGKTQFDETSLAFIRRQNKNLNDTEFDSLLNNLTGYVALDTTRNDFLYHTKLYQMLNQSRVNMPDLENFNAKVYADIFKTLDADKWLGLYTNDVYTALDGNGIK
jgi:hypothetical protein